MTDNDIIAEYVKENHPDLLKGIRFAKFRINKIGENDIRSIREKFEKLKTEYKAFERVEKVSDQAFYEAVRKKGIEYCKKNCGSDENLCGRCPLAFNLFCVNQQGCLIMNDDTTEVVAAFEQLTYMLCEIFKLDNDLKEVKKID